MEFAAFFSIRSIVLTLLFGIIYFLFGVAGLSLESGILGVSPFWPASGLAFFWLYHFGVRYFVGIFLGIAALAFYLGLPQQLAAITALGSSLEAIIPVFLLQRMNFDRGLRSIQDVTKFTGIAVILGPTISATLGASVLLHFDQNNGVEGSQIWLLWWLGNSLGIITVASLLFSLSTLRKHFFKVTCFTEMSVILLIAVTISFASFLLDEQHPSLLIFYLLLPCTAYAAYRYSLFGATFPVLAVITTLIFVQHYLDPTLFQHFSFDHIYQILAFLWVTTFTGISIASAVSGLEEISSLSHQAHHDPLTQLVNRRVIEQRIHRVLDNIVHNSVDNSLIFLDLDFLKNINDENGHQVGDQVLKELAELIRLQLRTRDTVSRYGGDEFLILLENCTLKEAELIAHNLLNAVRNHEFIDLGPDFGVTISMGLTLLKSNDTLLSTLSSADKALYQAKSNGRDQFQIA